MSSSSSDSSSSSSEHQTIPVTSFSSMLSWFLMDLPTVPDPLAIQAIALAARKFCLDTELYTKILSPITTLEDVGTYSLVSLIPNRTKVIRLKTVWYGQDVTTHSSPYDESNYDLEEENKFVFYTTPTSGITNGLIIEVVLRPAMNCKALDSWFFDRYCEAFMAYAKYYLLSMDRIKSWYDPQRAQEFLDNYRALISRYKREIFKKYKSADIHINHRQVKNNF